MKRRSVKDVYKLMSEIYKLKAQQILKSIKDKDRNAYRLGLGYIFLTQVSKRYAQLSKS